MNLNENSFIEADKDVFKKEFFRYFSFWPYVLIFVVFCFTIAYFYIRYEPILYRAESKIEIIDKAQDSEMALPTAMTVFNRSMINLENEKGILNSFNLHKNVVEFLDFNRFFYTVGNIKSFQEHPDDWFDDYQLEFKIDTDTIKTPREYGITIIDDVLVIDESFLGSDELIRSKTFKKLSTFETRHDFPFDIKIRNFDINSVEKKLILNSTENAALFYKTNFIVNDSGTDSDQLTLSLIHENTKILTDYLNAVMSEFDKDGISDRQLEYKRTMDFVDSRSSFLKGELELIELNKQNFKEINNLSDLESKANLNIQQQFEYNSSLFEAKSQKDLVQILKQEISDNSDKLMPSNIGVDDSRINILISEYNLLFKERERYLLSAGGNNIFVKKLDSQIKDFKNNIISSIENYEKIIQKKINNLELKEEEFANVFSNIPENERILRSIQRELEVKESLFLLLLQKREEAAINFAVVKPSIKVIDYARTSSSPVSPNKRLTFLTALIIGFSIPIFSLYLWFFIDNKIHTKDQLRELINEKISIIAEIPFVKNFDIKISEKSDNERNILLESARMLLANLSYSLRNVKSDSKVILVTSSVKGEGKTIISSTVSSILSEDTNKKTLLIGADLRNPQIHKLIGTDKNVLGISDYIYNPKINVEDILIRHNNLDILLSGSIPPNASQLLESQTFKNLIIEFRKKYEYIVIDTAPCLLVSDTFSIAPLADVTVYVTRSNYTDKAICDFINETFRDKKFNDLNLVLNSVGTSAAYGYQYGYQYGYRYGYKYGYNYGYGYGYSEDKSN